MITNTLFIEYTKKAFQWLIDLGFDPIYQDQCIYYERPTLIGKDALSFSWAEYDRILIFGVLIYKRFNRIEKILEPVVNSTSRYTIKKKLLLPPLADIEFLVDNHHIKDSFFISNERDVYTFSQAIQGNYDQIEGFLSSFKSPLMISDWLQEKGVNEHASLIVSDDNSFMLRKLVIMKEAGNKDFQELFSQYSIFLKSKNEKKESPYTAMYAKLIELTPYFIASNQEA